MESNDKRRKDKKDKKKRKPRRITDKTKKDIEVYTSRMQSLQSSHPDFTIFRQSARDLLLSQGTKQVKMSMSCSATAISSNVGGIIAATYDIQLSNFTDYISWATVFDEYRISRVHAKYMPNAWGTYDTSVTGAVPNTLVMYCDYDDAVAVGAYDTIWKHDNSTVGCTNHPLERSFAMSGGPDDNWITTATTNTISCTFKLYSTGLSISAAYGRWFIKGEVEFRFVQ